MTRRTHPLDPLIPGLTLGRITSGIFAGLAGGMVFGLLMLTSFVAVSADITETGMGPLLTELLGQKQITIVWFVHMLASAAFGVIFSVFIAPHSYRSSIIWALGYATVLWALAAMWILRRLTGTPVLFDGAAAYSLIGHLLFGLTLGIVYVAFHELEVREALDAKTPKWHAWGEHEREIDGVEKPVRK